MNKEEKELEKELNIEMKYYLRSIGKQLIDMGNEFDISKYKELKNLESSDLVDLVEYICYLIAINGDYRKNPIHILLRELKGENGWQRQPWKILENTANNFILHFARLRRNRLHKDITGKSFGDVLDTKVHIGTQV